MERNEEKKDDSDVDATGMSYGVEASSSSSRSKFVSTPKTNITRIRWPKDCSLLSKVNTRNG